MSAKKCKEFALEFRLTAALAGHNLDPFEPVEVLAGGSEARCRRCNQIVWVGDSGVVYSLLGVALFCIEHPKHRSLSGRSFS